MGSSEDTEKTVLATPLALPESGEKRETCQKCCKFTAFFLGFWLLACLLASILIDDYGTTIVYVKYNDLDEQLRSLRHYYNIDDDKKHVDDKHIESENDDKPSNGTDATLPAPPELPESTLAQQPLTETDMKKPEEAQAPLASLTIQVFDRTFFLPWYFSEGERRPPPSRRVKKTGRRVARIFPAEDAFIDRITNQLMFVPPDYKAVVNSGARKTILLYNGLEAWNLVAGGNAYFQRNECPVFTCDISTNREDAEHADMVLFKDHYEPIDAKRSPDQVYGLFWRGSPPYANLTESLNVINWTVTYRKDSTLVEPFKKWEAYDSRDKQAPTDINYAEGKTKKVAWYVNECQSHNNRMEVARELQKYIQVDIYGPCGDLECPNNDPAECSELFATEYKFYLAFENANCRDYITDEFYTNLIDRNVLPIAMGAHPDDYANRAPYRSYLHVDNFKSIKVLGDYLNVLDSNDKLYNRYFGWIGTGEFIDTKLLCRACAMLHDDYYFTSGLHGYVEDLNSWWNGPGICTTGDWKEDSHHHSAADASCGLMEGLLGSGAN